MTQPVNFMNNNFPGSGGAAGGGGPNGPASSSLSVPSSTSYGQPFLRVVEGSEAVLDITLKSSTVSDTPLDLTSVTRVEFAAKELPELSDFYIRKDISVVTPASGLVRLTLAGSELNLAGLWFGAVACYKDLAKVYETPCWLEVLKSLMTVSSLQRNTPLSVDDVRASMRDTVASFNPVFDDLEFSDNEVARAMVDAVRQWNDNPPLVEPYSQVSFPWRREHCRAACGFLLRTASMHKLRNELNYSAGNISIEDGASTQAYQQTAKMLIQEWEEWCALKKREINAEAFYGRTSNRFFGGSWM